MKNKLKFLGIITLVAIIGFSMVACNDGGGGGEAKKITVTGITENYETAMISFVIEDVSGMGEISNSSVTVDLLNKDKTAYTGSGSFYIIMGLYKDNKTAVDIFVYTGSVSNVDLSTEEKASNLKKLNVTSAVTTIAFNLFQEAPSWMTD
jgi:hypothetical protein